MWIIPTSKFSRLTKSKQRGQAVVEYLLLLVVVIGIFMVIAKPGIGKLGKKIQDSLNAGFFNSDPAGGGYYYFPVK